MSSETLSREAIIARNLEAVDYHFTNENPEGVEKSVSLYTDDIVWEVPSRRRLLRDKRAVADEYRRLFRSAEGMEREMVDRFATEDRVVTDEILHFQLTGDGFTNAPYPIGSKIEMRLVHIFHMRDGKIARENAYEIWRRVDDMSLTGQ